MPADQHVGAEVEILLGAMACDCRREGCSKSAPDLGTFAPWFNLPELKSFHRKKERRGQAGPEGVTVEIGAMQQIPVRAHIMSSKRRAGTGSLRDDSSVL